MSFNSFYFDLRGIWGDARYGWRGLRHHSGMTAAAVVTLALGVGANTAVFSGVSGVLLNPLPGVVRSGDLVELYATDRSRGTLELSSPEYRAYRDRSDTFDGLLAYSFSPTALSHGGSTDRIWSLLVSANYFDVLGVRTILGRALEPGDDADGARQVIVIGYGFWQRRFGGRGDIVGTTVSINSQPFTIVGVAPPEFRGTFPGLVFDGWIPLANEDRLIEFGRSTDRAIRSLSVIGRLKRGLTASHATERLVPIARDLAATFPETNRGLSVDLFPLSRSPRGAPALLGPLILVLMSVTALLLLMTCANVASLLVTRGAGRRREIAVRLALGASRARVLRMLLVESFELAAMGGVAGVVVGYWTAGWLASLMPRIDAPIDFTVPLDRGVLGFALAITAASGILFGLLPARQTVHLSLVPALKTGASGLVDGKRGGRIRSALVVSQIALTLTILVTAGLFIRSLLNAQAVEPGFNARGVMVGTLFLPSPQYDLTRSAQFYQRVIERVETLPHVRAAAVAAPAPLTLGGGLQADAIVVERYAPDVDERPWSYSVTISPGYFRALSVPMIDGRDFSFRDEERDPQVAIINEPLAARYFGGHDAIGRRVRLDGRWLTVIGVVPHFSMRQLNERPAPVIFVPATQWPRTSMTLLVRATGDPEGLVPAVRQIVRSADPQLPLYATGTLERHIEGASFPQRAAASFLSVFGVLALLLAAVGTYGVIAARVAQQAGEIAVRIALGASRADIVRLIMGNGFGLVLLGATFGLVGAVALTRIVGPFLFALNPFDATSFGTAVLLLLVAALVACYVPTHRAMRIDPSVTLRKE